MKTSADPRTLAYFGINGRLSTLDEKIRQQIIIHRTVHYDIGGYPSSSSNNVARKFHQFKLAVLDADVWNSCYSITRTAHSRFKIPLNADDSTTCTLPLTGPHAHIIQEAKLIIWDEAVMCGKYNFQTVDRALRDIMGAVDERLQDVPFGSKVVVFGGDFRQILPVVRKGTRSEVVRQSIRQATFWDQIQVLHLTQNMRIPNLGPEATAFAQKLLSIGNGDHQYNETVEIPEEWLMDSTDVTALIDMVYPSIRSPESHLTHYDGRAILAPKNINVDDINNLAYSIFPGEGRSYISNDKIIDSDDPEGASATYPVEFLHSIATSGVPRDELQLKVGMPIILLRNLDPDRGLCNGTKLFVTALYDHIIGVRRIDQGYDGDEYFLPRINMYTTEGEYPFILCRRQFPVRAAFAMTINKAQGQTLSTVGIYLDEPVFAHSQLYVALSRATDSANIKVALNLSNQRDNTIPKTNNAVYREALLPSVT
ncbi:hypothetical protein INT45_009974 [Circinella minor]|uniref:ATP-dependent DNA helicase n=1 Tax=Circinella minor TaxID=1195481 RepID=A0A8H7S6E0_9FUNG|nr:hypothetical protein INT45_009974 [Circinella minor]